MTNAKISPDGKYVGVLVPDGNSTKLVILDMATMDPTAGYNIADGEFIDDFNWINNHQVVWDAAKRMGPLSRTYAMGHLTIGNAEASKASSFDLPAYFAGRIRDAPDWILVEYREALYRWNIKTHAEKPVDEIPYGESNYLVDHSGKLRFVTGTDSADLVTAIRGEDGGGWKELHRASMSGGDMEPIAFSSDDHRVYVESAVDAPTRGIYEIDTATNESKLLIRDAGVDSDDVLIEPGTDEPAGVLTFPDYPAYHFFDPSSRTAQTYAALQKAFPNSIIKLTSASDDGKFCTVAIGSDTKPVALYLLDLEAHNLSPLLESKPLIDPAQKSPM